MARSSLPAHALPNAREGAGVVSGPIEQPALDVRQEDDVIPRMDRALEVLRGLDFILPQQLVQLCPLFGYPRGSHEPKASARSLRDVYT